MRIILGCIFLLCFYCLGAQPRSSDVEKVMAEINRLRASGCDCGGTWMQPVGPVSWDHSLYQVSRSYALYMERYKHFDHISLEGENLGDRLDRIGYDWQKVGENLAYGYHHFYEVLEAWKGSASHCTMLMDPDVTMMGLAKRGIYWVQSFSKPMETVYVQVSNNSYER